MTFWVLPGAFPQESYPIDKQRTYRNTLKKILLKIALTSLACLLATIAFVTVVTIILVNTVGLAPVVERYASEITGRNVTIGTLDVQWRESLSFRIDDLRLSNSEWGTEPHMIRLKHLQGAFELSALIKGHKLIQNLTIDGLEVFLERDQNGIGNWRFHDFSPSVAKDPFKHRSDQRGDFPIIMDANIVDSVFRMKTSSGAMIQIDAYDLKFGAADNGPILLTIDGAYNGKRTTMAMAGDTYAVLHDAKTPYPIKLRIARTSDTLDFEGTMTDPINVDGAKGMLTLNAPDMGDVFSMFGLNMQATFPLRLKTPITRAGDRWDFEKLEGDVAGTDFRAVLVLNEGSRETADDFVGTVDFDTLDARHIIDGISKLKRPTKKSDFNSVPLAAAKDPSITVDVDLGAKAIRYDDWLITDARLHAKNEPGKVSVEELKFSVALGTVSMDMHFDATGSAPLLKSQIDIKGVDVGRVVRLAKDPDTKKTISGPLNARAVLEMQGNTVEQGLRSSKGGIVAYMNDGRISKKFLELASVDLNILVGGTEGQEKMSCLLGVFTMRNGLGTLSPLKLSAPSASLTGGGGVNLLNRQIDVFMKPVEGTTGFLALDVPLHFTGDLTAINIEPLVFGNSKLPAAAVSHTLPTDLLPELKAIAMKSSCIK